MYTPDPSIITQLRECDPDLGARWNGSRWVVTCQGKDAILVQNSDGSYRPLDGRIVTRMRREAWEYRKFFGAFHLQDRELYQSNYELERRAEAERRDKFRQYAKEEIYPRVVGVGGENGRNKFAGWSKSA